MPSRRKGNSSAKKKAAGGKMKSKKQQQQNDEAKIVDAERTGMTTQSLEEIMGTINGLNLGTPAKDSKEKAGLKNESDQEDSEKKMIEETFLLAQREAPTILRRNNYNRGKAVDELKELLARTSPSLHAEIRADIAGEQVESSLRDLAEEALRYELERRAHCALDLFDMDRSKAIEDVTELIGSNKMGMIVPKKFQQKDAQVKLAEEAVDVVFGATAKQRRREKQEQKEKQKQKAAQNGADPSGKPKSHTVGDLSGGWFGDDDYAAVSSEGDISEAQNAMMLEEALRAELKGKAYGVLARCGIDRSKAVEEMKRVVVKVARNVAPTKILPEDETLRLAEDAVNAALKAVQDDGNARLAKEIRKEQEIQQQRPGAYSVENEAMSILRRNGMDRKKSLKELNGLLAQNSPMMADRDRTALAEQAIDEAIRYLADSVADDKALFEEESLRLNGSSSLSEHDMSEELKGFAYLALRRCNMNRAKAVEMVIEMSEKDPSHEAPTKLLQEGKKLKLAEDAVDAMFDIVLGQRQIVEEQDQEKQNQEGAQPGGQQISDTNGDLSKVDNASVFSSEGDTSKAESAKREETIRIELKQYAFGIVKKFYMDRAKAVAEILDLIGAENSLQEDAKLRLAEEAVDNVIMKQREFQEQDWPNLPPDLEPPYGYGSSYHPICGYGYSYHPIYGYECTEEKTSNQSSDGDWRTWHSDDNMKARNDMMTQIVLYLQTGRLNDKLPIDDEWRKQLPTMATHLEGQLYKSAPSLDAYRDTSTLGHRLQMLTTETHKGEGQDEIKRPGPSLAAVMSSNAKEGEDESRLPDLAKNWFATNHRVHPPIGKVLVDDSWCRLAMTEMTDEDPGKYQIKTDMSDHTFGIWYTAAYVDPSDDFIYYSEQGEDAKLNSSTGVWWYDSEEAACLAVKRVVAAAQKSRRDAAADDSGSDMVDTDDELWEMCAHLPLHTDRTCDTCGRRAVAKWVEHGSKGGAMAQCLPCQTIRYMHSYEGPYREWPSGTEMFRIHSLSEYLGPLLLARVSDFDPRSIGDIPECVQCGDTISPARGDAVVCLRPCCGNMICVDCSKPPRDRFGRSECTLCHGSLSRAVGDHRDNFIIRGKCGHVYHFECHCDYLNDDSRDDQRCPECPERWEPSGRYSVAHRCSCGEEVLALPDDEDKVISLLLKKASAGDGYAQYFLGLHHCDLSTFIIGGKKALKFGVKLLERAMERGYVPAFRMLAKIHYTGICETEKSIENANNLFKGIVDEELAEFLTPIAAELSLVSAKKYREEGNRYRYIQFIKDAAQKGNAEAVGILGNLYLGSRLKSKDEIIQMFRTAVAYGDQSCREKYRFHLANLYREEGNVAKYVKNLKWASYSGHVEATYLVGAYHLVGLYGCKKDPDIALLYLNRARSMGHSVADEVICARLTRSIQLVVYFDETCLRKSERLYINIDPSSTIRIAREMVQTETGVSADAFDLLSTHGKFSETKHW